MENQEFMRLFIGELEDIYSAEKQITRSLPRLIELSSFQELKDALSKHLKETEHQVERIEKIATILEISLRENTCEGMEGLLKEAQELVKNKQKSPVLDAAIISAAQKVEHYEIASYGTLRNFAKQLDLDSDVIDLLQDSLDEEGSADKKLTKIADGSFFSRGVNKEAEEYSAAGREKKWF